MSNSRSKKRRVTPVEETNASPTPSSSSSQTSSVPNVTTRAAARAAATRTTINNDSSTSNDKGKKRAEEVINTGSSTSNDKGKRKAEEVINNGSSTSNDKGKRKAEEVINNGSSSSNDKGKRKAEEIINTGSSTSNNKGKGRAEEVINTGSSPSNNKGKGRAEEVINTGSSTSNDKGKGRAEEVINNDSSTSNSNGNEPDNGESSTSNKKERRKARCRTVCSKRTKDRINRATSQRMYLIERKDVDQTKKQFTVMGSTGNMFVYLKVLRVPSTSKLIFQRALLSKEIRSIFSKSPDLATLANYRVRSFYNSIAKVTDNVKRRPIDGDCPICYEPLKPEEVDTIVWCRGGCGNNIHKDCFTQWKNTRNIGIGYGRVTCVFCRKDWKENLSERFTKDGFLNLGSLQNGVSRITEALRLL
ncbi:18138_t:CDS:2, partial [Dentiscutata erythropus]